VSRSAGTGNPIWFHCSQARKIWYTDVERTRRERNQHSVTLTGRTKVNPSRRRSSGRVSDLSREYRCSCGHIGWSTHKALERMEQRET
jgi:hypothetical protein